MHVRSSQHSPTATSSVNLKCCGGLASRFSLVAKAHTIYLVRLMPENFRAVCFSSLGDPADRCLSRQVREQGKPLRRCCLRLSATRHASFTNGPTKLTIGIHIERSCMWPTSSSSHATVSR